MQRALFLAVLALPFAMACGGSGATNATSSSTGSTGATTTAGATTTSTTTGTGGHGTGGSSSTTTGAGGAGGEGGTGGVGGTGGSGGQFTPGMPIQAPSETWTWVPFDDAFCANGTTTGIGVNLTQASSRVLIYLEGGGACWSALTCYTLMTASYFTTGYGPAEFATESTDATYLAEPGGFFDRTAAANPFKDYSYVYVPYCTGDIHAGNNVADYGAGMMAKHVGFKNVTSYLERIVPTFPTADRVILAGSSAGGFGALYNYWQTQQAFGTIRVDYIDDSGTPMPADIPEPYQPAEEVSWGLASTLPPGCTACLKGLDALFGFYAQKFPTHRGALLSYTADSTLPTFSGISTAQFTMGLDELTSKEIAPTPATRFFLETGSGHVLWFDPLLTQSGSTLQQFVTEMVTDDVSWTNVM